MRVAFPLMPKAFRTASPLLAVLAVSLGIGSIAAVSSPQRLLFLTVVGGLAVGMIVMLQKYRSSVPAKDLPLLTYVGTCAVAIGILLSTHNGVRLNAHMTASDAALLIGAAMFGASFLVDRAAIPPVPWWLLIGAGGIMVAGILSATQASDVATASVDAAEFTVALLGTPILLALATGRLARVRIALAVWMASVAINSAVALLDGLRLTSIGPALIGAEFQGRPTGLTIQPNHLGLACAMVTPVAFLYATRRGPATKRIAGILMIGVVGIGVLISGSRAAVVAAICGILLVPLLAGGLWKRAILLIAVGAAGVLLFGTALAGQDGGTAQGFLATNRLFGGASGVADSNNARLGYYSVALEDFAKHPVTGSGFDLVRNAHDIYFQLLQAGGIPALLAFSVFCCGTLSCGIRLSRDLTRPEEMRNYAAALTASMVVWLVAGLAQNLVFDRYLYLPAGLLLGLRLSSLSTFIMSANNEVGIELKVPVRGDQASWSAV